MPGLAVLDRGLGWLATPSYADTIRNIPDLVAYYPLTEMSGLTARAAVGTDGAYQSTGVVYGAPGLIEDGSSSIRFTGSPGRVQVVTPVGLPTGAAARTLCGWFKTTGGFGQDVCSYGTANTRQSWGMGVISSTNVEFWAYANDTQWNVGAPANGLRHFYAVTYNGVTGIIGYYDGAQCGTLTLVAALNTVVDANGFSIGRDYFQAAKYMQGSIGHVAVFNRALTANEIRNLYAIGAGR